MSIHFCAASRIQVDVDTEKLVQKLTNDYEATLGSDYWFVLYNDRNEILAECSVDRIFVPCTNYIHHYYIGDVWVPQRFRGNSYAVALLLNILYYFDQNSTCQTFRLCAFADNVSACRCYEKVFGTPYACSNDLVYFST